MVRFICHCLGYSHLLVLSLRWSGSIARARGFRHTHLYCNGLDYRFLRCIAARRVAESNRNIPGIGTRGIFYTIGGVIYGVKAKFLEFKHMGFHM